MLPHPFPPSEVEAAALQSRLAPMVVTEDRLPNPVRLLAGVDVAYATGTDRAFAAVVVFDGSGSRVVETAVAESRSTFPYVPGLLSFRELPTIARAFERLKSVPDLVLCDGHGIAHPRRFGLASHLALLYDVPAIGCAKSCLVGVAREPGPNRGDRSDLTDRGELIGAVLRTRAAVKPVYVSPGHRISLDTACAWVLRLCPKYRPPEPIRAAKRLANELRAVILRRASRQER